MHPILSLSLMIMMLMMMMCVLFSITYIYIYFRGGGRGGGGRGGGMKGGSKVVIEPHRHEGVFIARGKEDALVTLNSTPGVAVYGEKRISVESPPGPDGVAVKVEYRVWNPFRSKSESTFFFILLLDHMCFEDLLKSSYYIILLIDIVFPPTKWGWIKIKINLTSCRCHLGWCRQYMDETWLQGPIPWSCRGDIRLSRIRHCRPQRQCLRRRILPPSRAGFT